MAETIKSEYEIRLEKLEKLSVEKAIEEGKKQLFQNEIRITPGVIGFDYISRKGEKSINWRGGITERNNIIRTSIEYKLWREAVFKRDKYTCIWGGKEHGSNLHADHIKPFAYFPELRFAIDNGRTLCVSCHKTTETYGNRGKKLYEKK